MTCAQEVVLLQKNKSHLLLLQSLHYQARKRSDAMVEHQKEKQDPIPGKGGGGLADHTGTRFGELEKEAEAEAEADPPEKRPPGEGFRVGWAARRALCSIPR